MSLWVARILQTRLQNGFSMCKITVTIHFLSALSREELELHTAARLIDMGGSQTLRQCQALTAYTTHASIHSSTVGKNKCNFMFL